MNEHDLSAPVWEGERAPFARAFVAAQSKVEAVLKGAENAAFKVGQRVSKYADLAACVEAVKPALNAAGIGVLQFPSFDGERVGVTTTLLHESGASVSATLHMRPTKADPQGIGSAITYARRYALLAIVGAAPEDDDGNAASAQGDGGKRFTGEPSAARGAALAAVDVLETEAACLKWWKDNSKAIDPADHDAIVDRIKERKAAIIARNSPDDPIPFGDEFPGDHPMNRSAHA